MDIVEKIKQEKSIAQGYLNKMKSSAERGIPFLLTVSEYKRLKSRKTCYYTGITMTHDNPTLGSHFTLDRINAEIGYTRENTVACCHAANKAKALFEKKGYINISHLKKMTDKLFG